MTTKPLDLTPILQHILQQLNIPTTQYQGSWWDGTPDPNKPITQHLALLTDPNNNPDPPYQRHDALLHRHNPTTNKYDHIANLTIEPYPTITSDLQINIWTHATIHPTPTSNTQHHHTPLQEPNSIQQTITTLQTLLPKLPTRQQALNPQQITK